MQLRESLLVLLCFIGYIFVIDLSKESSIWLWKTILNLNKLIETFNRRFLSMNVLERHIFSDYQLFEFTITFSVLNRVTNYLNIIIIFSNL
jgi:hypothetical protein